MSPPVDGDITQQLARESLVGAQLLRRKDDLKRVQFRQRTSLYSMLSITAITAVLIWRDTDIGRNITEILTWIVIGHVVVICAVAGVKGLESVAALRGAPK